KPFYNILRGERTLKKKIRIDGYIKNNLVEPISIHARHNVLAWEMIRRNMIKGKTPIKHKSPINADELFSYMSYLPGEYINFKIDQKKALNDLLNRCLECRRRYILLVKYELDPFNSFYLPPEYDTFKRL
ncbi:MAG: hypothetical protein ACOC2W_03045, partial [bacterium]